MLVLVYFTWSYAWRAKELRVIYEELNERKRLEIDLTKEREVSKKKSFFLSAIGHDLRTPLTGMLLQARLAEKRLDRNDVAAVREGLNDIRTLANEANTLLSEFLEMGRLDSESLPMLEISAQSISGLLNQVVEMFQPQATAKGIGLHIESTLDGEVIQTDREKLQRVLNNLVGNAIKFTQKGDVTIKAAAEGDEIRIDIVDTGPGIDETNIERLFDEFYQVENRERDREKGFGLGLAIAKRMTGRLGGRLAVTSELGVGSQFTVMLPREGPEV
jgi:signal transduction histidine kinase